MKLGVITNFDAAHSLPRYDGKCRNVHGHTYTVEVIVEGEIDAESNFVMDYMELKLILEAVLERLDHRYLNDVIEYPTCEMIATYIKEELLKELSLKEPPIKLVSLKIWEGKDKWVMIE
ncbi:MAG: 6-carboxytetrahydropterin synthase QueD [Halobacteriota archaeon]|nr:6-carboxytetrahydropterin synthase QueD [Halobacteriota archaeon]